MALKIREINSKEIWENFLLEIEEKTFLQSWDWGEFQFKIGEKIWRLGIYEINSQLTTQNPQLLGLALVIKIVAKRGNFLFVPHGPLIRESTTSNKQQVLETLLEKLKGIARDEKVTFIRVAPLWERTEENIEIFQKLGFKTAPIHIHPEITWQLNLAASEDKILRGVRKTTRNLIRRCQKEGVKIYTSKNPKDVKLFYSLYQETVSRHHFTPFSYDFLEKEFESFLPNNILLFFARWQEKILSGAMVIFWQKIAFYHQGASSSVFSKIPASHLLQWEIIKESKRRGCLLYNFWGIAPTENRYHPWYGLTIFKKGFGGEKREYVKTQDFPLSAYYLKNWLIETFRRKRRRL